MRRMNRHRSAPAVEPLDGRAAPSAMPVTPPDVNAPDTVQVSPAPQPTDDRTNPGYAPGLGGAPGGSGDRGSPPGVVGD